MGKISDLKYPKKSHRKSVLLPRYSIELAEFFGIMMGDGGINNSWQITITLNAIKDKQYAIHVIKLCESLFGIVPAVRKRKDRQALVICLSSTTVVDFLVQHGLIRGNKLNGGLKIPAWILGKKSYRIACVRGLMDTDGCLYIHTHYIAGKQYKNLGLCFCSHSFDLIDQVANIFKENKIIGHLSNQGRSIYLYKANDVIKYLEIFNTANDRISSVLINWRSARVV